MQVVLKERIQKCFSWWNHTHLVSWSSSMWKGFKNGKKSYFMSEGNIALLFPGGSRHNISFVQR